MEDLVDEMLEGPSGLDGGGAASGPAAPIPAVILCAFQAKHSIALGDEDLH